LREAGRPVTPAPQPCTSKAAASVAAARTAAGRRSPRTQGDDGGPRGVVLVMATVAPSAADS